MFVSVIICTHNPRKDVLQYTLDALKQQTLDPGQWDLLLIDNASKPAVGDFLVADDLPIRIIREDTLGLTPARLRGIREAQSDLIVFVDDDNVLTANYLHEALNIHESHPEIGAFGGSIRPIFEEEAPSWTLPYWYLLAVRETTEDHLSMHYGDAAAEPCGAGLCVRQKVAVRYARHLADDPVRRALDRSGNSLASSGDMDLVYTAFDLGYGIGRFQSLVLDHLIPPSRLTEAYFLRIFEGMSYSGMMLKKIRQRPEEAGRASLMKNLRRCKQLLCSPSFDRKMLLAELRGKRRALADWKKYSET